MADRTVKAYITGDSSSAIRAFADAASAADAASSKIDRSLSDINTNTDTASGGFGKLKLAALGIVSSLGPLTTVAEGLGVGLLGIGAAAGIGLGAFALASKQVAAEFKVSASAILQNWQTAMAPIVSPVFTDALKILPNLLNDLTPVVQGASAGLQSMLGTFSQLAAQGGVLQNFFKTFGGIIQQVFTALGPIIGNLLTGVTSFLTAAGPIITVVLGLLTQLSTAFAGLDFANILGPLAASFLQLEPIVSQFISSLVSVIGTILHALTPIGTALFGVIATAVTAITPLIQTLGQVIGAIAPVIAQVAQALGGALGGAIQAVVPVIQALLPIIAQVVNLLGGAFTNIIVQTAPAFESLAKIAATFFSALASALGPASTGISSFLSDISPLTFVFDPLSTALTQLTPLFGQLAQALGADIGPAMQIVGALISAVGTAVEALVPALVPLVGAILTAFISLLQQLAPILSQIASVISGAVVGAVQVLVPLLAAILPVLQALLPVLSGEFIGALQILVGILKVIPGPLLGIVGALVLFRGPIGSAISSIKGLVLGLQELTGAEVEADAAADANPLGALILALVALGAGIYELATHWQEVWTDIKNWTDDAIAFLRSGIGTTLVTIIFLPIAPLILLALHWQQVWSGIQTVTASAWNDVIKPVVDFIKAGLGDIGTVVQILESAWDAVWGGIKTAVQDAWNFIKPIFDTIKSGVKDVTDGINSIKNAGPSVGGVSLNPLHYLAGGGPASANTPYIVGENGPELFIPTASGVVVPNGVTTSGAGGSASGAGGGNVYVTVNAPMGFIGSETQLAQALQTLLSRYAKTQPGQSFLGQYA